MCAPSHPAAGDDSLDVAPIFRAVARQWRVVALATVVAALASGLISYLLLRTYEATAVIALTRFTSSLTLEPKFRTGSPEDQAAPAASRTSADTTARLQTLAELVRAEQIAIDVTARLGDTLPADLRTPDRIIEVIDAKVVKGADSIQLSARHHDQDLARVIVNTWAQYYAAHVNRLYASGGQTKPGVDAELVAAKGRYDAAQSAFIAFIKDSTTDQLTQQIAEKKRLVDILAKARQDAIGAVVGKEMESKAKHLGEFVAAESDYIGLAFRADQDTKQKILAAYIDARLTGRIATFQREYDDLKNRLQTNYALRLKLDQQASDARALLDQIGTGGADLLSNRIAIIGIKQIYNTTGSLPAQLQLDLRESDIRNDTRDGQVREVEAIVASIEKRRAVIDAEIERDSNRLLDGNGLRYMLVGDRDDSGDATLQAIIDEYLRLLRVGPLTRLSEQQAGASEIRQRISAQARQMLQLMGSDSLATFTSRDEPVTKALDALQEEIRALNADLETTKARNQELSQARDLAWESYTTLSRKAVELSITAEAAGSQVSVGTNAARAERAGLTPVRAVPLGAVAGLVVGLAAAIVLGYRREGQVEPLAGERAPASG